MQDYSIEFCTIATQSQWTDLSLGLQDVIKDELIHRSWDNNLDRLIRLACDIEECQRERDLERRSRHDIPLRPRRRMSPPRYASTLQEEELELMPVGHS